jgi:hypothetical protein
MFSFLFFFYFCLFLTIVLPFVTKTEPEKQFALVYRHVERIREQSVFRQSEIVFMVERNLGFEAEHHERALRDIPMSRHRIDHQAKRFGILTTEDIKYGMMTLLNTMLRDQRVNVSEPLLSEDPLGNRRRLREQLIIYSFQYKAAANAFGKQRVTLNGKVGGMKDDVCIALQLAVYYSNQAHMYI